jgi:hypothetical protein
MSDTPRDMLRAIEAYNEHRHSGAEAVQYGGGCLICLAKRVEQLERELAEARKDTAIVDWIVEHATSHGGGNGFELRVFVPHDSECIRDGILTAIAAQKGKTE